MDRKQKVLILNASPHRDQSCTMRLTRKFVEGMREVMDCDVEEITLSGKKIEPCAGCMRCWQKTPGQCAIRDDFPALKQKVLEADIVIESFPLYFFGMPGILKNFTDRMLGELLPYEGHKPEPGKPFHGFREEMHGKKLVIVSTCGYSQTDLIYDPLLRQYDCIFGPGNYSAVLCAQGKVFSAPELFDRLEKYLEKHIAAGREFAETGTLSKETEQHLRETPFNERRFQLLMDMFW